MLCGALSYAAGGGAAWWRLLGVPAYTQALANKTYQVVEDENE
jgi:hypothetical protein